MKKEKPLTTAECRCIIKEKVDKLPAKYLDDVAECIYFLTNAKFKAQMKQAEKEIVEGKGIPWSEIKREFSTAKRRSNKSV